MTKLLLNTCPTFYFFYIVSDIIWARLHEWAPLMSCNSYLRGNASTRNAFWTCFTACFTFVLAALHPLITAVNTMEDSRDTSSLTEIKTALFPTQETCQDLVSTSETRLWNGHRRSSWILTAWSNFRQNVENRQGELTVTSLGAAWCFLWGHLEDKCVFTLIDSSKEQ